MKTPRTPLFKCSITESKLELVLWKVHKDKLTMLRKPSSRTSMALNKLKQQWPQANKVKLPMMKLIMIRLNLKH